MLIICCRCIGGIGIFVAQTGIEVTTNVPLSHDRAGWDGIVNNLHLLGVVVLFELTLRVLNWKTKSKYPLLSPIYFCSIPFIFYAFLFIFRIDVEVAQDAGYFFPKSGGDTDGSSSSLLGIFSFDEHTFDLLHILDFRTISWDTVVQSIGTMISLTVFSLIHVPGMILFGHTVA